MTNLKNISKVNYVFIIAIIVGIIGVGIYLLKLHKDYSEQREIELNSVHNKSIIEIQNSINNFATLISGIRAYINKSDTIPNVYELQNFVNDLLQEVDYKDSIIVSVLDTNHIFKQTFTRTQIDPAHITGKSVYDLRDSLHVKQINKVLLDKKIHLFNPMNLYEGWPGLSMNFSIWKNNHVIGYVGPIISFRTIIEPIYQNKEVIKKFAFKFSIVDGPSFDRVAVYDGFEIYSKEKDSENYQNFSIEEEDFKYSILNIYGLKIKVGTAYKKSSPELLLSFILIIGWFITIVFLSWIIYKQFSKVHELNSGLNKTLDELKMTQKQLVESEKMASLGNLVAGIAHEINTPIGIGVMISSNLKERITNFNELVAQNKLRKVDLDDFILKINESGELLFNNMTRAGSLINSFKQISVDKTSENQRNFNLFNYLTDVVKSIQPELRNYNIQISIDCDKNLIISSYPGAIAQIITNFIINSKNHAFETTSLGKIDIKVELENNFLNLIYRDNGKGISPEIIEKVFDPFLTTNLQKGSGLGLHLVYNLVTQKLNGSINLESKLNNGVEFRIKFPIK